jgi:hypothetical protein
MLSVSGFFLVFWFSVRPDTKRLIKEARFRPETRHGDSENPIAILKGRGRRCFGSRCFGVSGRKEVGSREKLTRRRGGRRGARSANFGLWIMDFGWEKEGGVSGFREIKNPKSNIKNHSPGASVFREEKKSKGREAGENPSEAAEEDGFHSEIRGICVICG